MIGKTISHYKILEKLGSGGMGVVYQAEDTKLKRTVALKFLTAQAIGSEEEKTRFLHEAQAAATLLHPNVATIFDFEHVEGQSFIVMEFVEGQSLKKKIEAGPLKLDEALDLAIQTAEGLQAAHEKGIVHRDIKSANVMVSDKGQAKITDFGLAKVSGRTQLTKEGTTLGTVAYMSPEQAQGVAVDHRTDIWSLGVVVHEILTGQQPFAGDYEQAVVYSIMSEDPEPLTGLRTGVPMALERIVNKCLTKGPSERYQHADEMLVDLRRIKKEIETGPSKLHPVKEEQLLRKHAIRYGSFATLGLVLLLMGFYLWQKVGNETSSLTDSRNKIRLAVLPFDNDESLNSISEIKTSRTLCLFVSWWLYSKINVDLRSYTQKHELLKKVSLQVLS